MDRGCIAKDCLNKHYAKGYCVKHYNRIRRHGDPYVKHPDAIKGCKVENCNKKHFAKGYCHTHYHRWKYTGRLDHIDPGCLVPDKYINSNILNSILKSLPYRVRMIIRRRFELKETYLQIGKRFNITRQGVEWIIKKYKAIINKKYSILKNNS